MEKIAKFGFAANDLSRLNADNIRALAGVQDDDDRNMIDAKMGALREALATQIKTAAGDVRIRNKVGSDVQELLRFDVPPRETETPNNGGQPPAHPSGNGGGGPFANVGKNNPFSNRGGSGPSASPSL